LPRTPAPAIWVVLVITDRDAGADALSAGGPGVQPVHSVTDIVVAAAAVAAAERTASDNTRPTVASCQLTPPR
jgi:hypothetical protein